MPSDDEQAQDSQSEVEDGLDGKMWPVIEIFAEKNNQYRVRWEGTDPATGKPWLPSWIPKKDASTVLVDDWKERKARKAQGKRQSKSNASKAKGRSRASDTSNATKNASGTPSTSISAHDVYKPESVLSISSTASIRPSVNSSNRKRRASLDFTASSPIAGDATITSPSRPRKKQKLEVLIVTPPRDHSQSSYEVIQNKKFGKSIRLEDGEGSGSSQILPHYPSQGLDHGNGELLFMPQDGQKIFDDRESLLSRVPDTTLVKKKRGARGQVSPVASSSKSYRQPEESRRSKVASKMGDLRTRGTKSMQLTPNIRLILRQEEEESTQEAEATPCKVARPDTIEASHVPGIDLSRLPPSKSRLRWRTDQDSNIQVPIEDISIPRSEHNDTTGVTFDLHHDYGADEVDLVQHGLAEHRGSPPPVPLKQAPDPNTQPTLPTTPVCNIQRSDNQGSMIISRMKSNQSIPGPPLSSTNTRNMGQNPDFIQANGKVEGNKDGVLTVKPSKVLHPLPRVTPSKFAPHLPQDEAPLSSIEDFSPDKVRSGKGTNRSTETDDIVDADDSLADDMLKKRGQELADRAAEAKRKERQNTALVRRPLKTASTAPSSTAHTPQPANFHQDAIEQGNKQADHELLQAMVDNYVDLSGGYPEEAPSFVINGTAGNAGVTSDYTQDKVPSSIAKGMQDASTNHVVSSKEPDHFDEEDLPPTDSFQANTDSQGRSQESEVGKSQQLDNAVNLLHDKSEEIESLQSQLSEQHERYSVLQANFERLQVEHEALLVQKEVQGKALVEAKEHIRTLGAHIDSLDQRQETWAKEKQQFTSILDEESKKSMKEREMFLHYKDELERQKTELEKPLDDRTQGVTSLESDWLQKQSAWEAAKELWSVERREWLEKEALWAAEKEGLQEKHNGWEKEEERLQGAIKDAEKDSEFFRTQYSTASSFADSVRIENVELQKQNEAAKKEATIAHGQARDGVKLVKGVYELRVKKLQEELDNMRSLCDLLKTKDERTNDEIRRLAASYPELEDENTRLQEELKELRESEGNMASAMANLIQDDGDGFDEGDFDSSLEYEDEFPVQDLPNPGLVEHKGGSDADEEGYVCKWTWCGVVFDKIQDLMDHITTHHSFE